MTLDPSSECADVIAISRQDYEYELRSAPWTLWAPLDETTVAQQEVITKQVEKIDKEERIG